MAGAVSVRAGWGSEPSPQRTTETEGAARAMEGVGGGDGGARQRELERMAEVLVTGEQLRQFSSVAQSCPSLCNPMNRSTPGLPVYYQLPEFTQTHVHRVSDAI